RDPGAPEGRRQEPDQGVQSPRLSVSHCCSSRFKNIATIGRSSPRGSLPCRDCAPGAAERDGLKAIAHDKECGAAGKNPRGGRELKLHSQFARLARTQGNRQVTEDSAGTVGGSADNPDGTGRVVCYGNHSTAQLPTPSLS